MFAIFENYRQGSDESSGLYFKILVDHIKSFLDIYIYTIYNILILQECFVSDLLDVVYRYYNLHTTEGMIKIRIIYSIEIFLFLLELSLHILAQIHATTHKIPLMIQLYISINTVLFINTAKYEVIIAFIIKVQSRLNSIVSVARKG